MRILTFFLTLLAFTATTQGQNVISVNTSAEVFVPADRISFRINLNAEADTPQKAYDLHKKREKVLIQLLKKHNIQEEDINFEPISISKTYNDRYSNTEKKRIQTRQAVILSLDNFSIYEKIQITLIDNDFDEFNGNFMSSKSKEAKDEALKKALKSAREKANIIAEETGLTIIAIKEINYSHNQGPPRPVMEMASFKASDSLLEFDQTVTVSASVSVTYNIAE